MAFGNFPTFASTGDRGVDEFLRRLDARLKLIEKGATVTVSAPSSTVVVPGETTIEVRNEAGTFSQQERGIEFDDTNGFDLTQSGANANVHIENLTLPGTLAVTGTTNVDRGQKNGGTTYSRNKFNFIDGSNITITVADNAGNSSVDVTIDATGSSGITVLEAIVFGA